jgi:hypothetical protein
MNDLEPHSAAPQREPLFLERDTYRRRRLMDAAGLLPFVVVFLFSIPLLWSRGDEGPAVSVVIFYIFGVWLVMAIVTAIVSIRLRDTTRVFQDDMTGHAPE